jgi:hypothetical protein
MRPYFLVDDAHPQLQSCVAARGACLVAAGRGLEAERDMTRALRLAERRWEQTLGEKIARDREERERAAAAAERKGSIVEEDEDDAMVVDKHSKVAAVQAGDTGGAAPTLGPVLGPIGASGVFIPPEEKTKNSDPPTQLQQLDESEAEGAPEQSLTDTAVAAAAAVVLHAQQSLAKLLYIQVRAVQVEGI